MTNLEVIRSSVSHQNDGHYQEFITLTYKAQVVLLISCNSDINKKKYNVVLDVVNFWFGHHCDDQLMNGLPSNSLF